MDAATFASEHGCAEAEAEIVLTALGPALAAEMFVRCNSEPDYQRRLTIASELLRRRERTSP